MKCLEEREEVKEELGTEIIQKYLSDCIGYLKYSSFVNNNEKVK